MPCSMFLSDKKLEFTFIKVFTSFIFFYYQRAMPYACSAAQSLLCPSPRFLALILRQQFLAQAPRLLCFFKIFARLQNSHPLSNRWLKGGRHPNLFIQTRRPLFQKSPGSRFACARNC